MENESKNTAFEIKPGQTKPVSAAEKAALPLTETEVITPEQRALMPIIETETLEDKIKSLPVRYDVTAQRINALKKKYSKLTGLDESGNYVPAKLKEVTDALKVLRDLRTGAADKKDELNADALKWQRAVNAEAKRITEELEAIEKPLKAAKLAAETKQKEAQILKEKQEEEAFSNRISLLIETGLSYRGDKYVNEDLEIDPAGLKSMSETDFITFLDTAKELKARQDKEAEEKAEEDRIAREKQEADRIKLEEDQRILKEQQEALQKQTEELQKTIAEQQKQLEEQQKKADEERRKLDEEKEGARLQTIKTRQDQLFNMGLAYSESAQGYALQATNVSTLQIQTLDAAQWLLLIESITPDVTAAKQAIEKARLEKIEADRLQKVEDDRIAAEKAEEERLEAERVAKEKKRVEDERLAALLPEKEKVNNYISKFGTAIDTLADEMPEIENEELRNIVTKFVSSWSIKYNDVVTAVAEFK